jgi:hypothetical protein
MPGFEDSSRIPLRAEGPLRPFYNAFDVVISIFKKIKSEYALLQK